MLIRPDGTRFRACELENGLKLNKGDIAMFTYDNYSRYSLPVNPKVYRIRTDITWEEIIFNFHNDTQQNLHGK